ncbi:hypothetical protein BOVMAS36_14550 [Streptococcus uberis]
MLNITAKYPHQLPDGSIDGTNVILDGTDSHSGWHIPLVLPKEYLDKSQDEVLKMCQEMISQKLDPSKALAEKFEELKSVTTTSSQSLITLISILYSKGTLTDEDIISIG